MEDKRLVVIDGTSLLYRAYFAIQRPMITQEGLYTQGVYGFLSMLQKIKADYNPTHILVAWDKKGPTFRHAEFEGYKAGRPKMPPELAMQMPLIKEILQAMNIRMCEVESYEADDIIGTAVHMAEAEQFRSFVITGDKDALQLAAGQTSVIITKKGISEFSEYDEASINEEFGFGPQQYIDYMGLRGDPSDNIPGVPGVGEKTALKLVQQFGSIENMFENLDEIESAKLRERIQEHESIALFSKKLATIYTHVPLECTLKDCEIKRPNTEELIKLYARLEFRTHMKKLMEQEAKQAAEINVSENSPDEHVPVRVLEQARDIESWLGTLNADEPVVIEIQSDGNHTDTPTLHAMTCLFGNDCVYVKGIPELPGILRAILSGKTLRFIGHQLQRTYYALMMNGIDVENFRTEFDTSLAQYVLSPNKRAPELDTLLFEVFGYNSEEHAAKDQQVGLFEEDTVQVASGIGEKLSLIRKLSAMQAEQIHEQELSFVLHEIEFPLCKILAEMEMNGMSVDRDALFDFGEILRKKIVVLEAEIYELAGSTFNINSPQQLGVVLFEDLKLPSAKSTKRGYATGAEILEKLAPDYEIVRKVLEYRTLTKLNSTYVEGMLPLIDQKGKIHAHFQQTVAATGRISCTEPNLQNIPVRQELGRQLRKAFVAENGDYILIGADYSQIELRVLAHMSQDLALIEGFNEGADVHRQTAARMFGVDEELVTEKMRSDAKAINFGIIYGMGSFRLANELEISRVQADKYINDYFAKHASVKKFMDDAVQSAKDKGYSETLFGRKRPIPEIHAQAFAVRQQGERLAMNTPIQGTAADIIKLAMIKVTQAIKRECPKSALILQVHDELIIQAHKSESAAVKRLLKESMMQAANLTVAMDVSLNEGQNWYLLK